MNNLCSSFVNICRAVCRPYSTLRNTGETYEKSRSSPLKDKGEGGTVGAGGRGRQEFQTHFNQINRKGTVFLDSF